MTARERAPRDAGPDAIPAALRFAAAVIVAGALVGLVRGVLRVLGERYLDADFRRLALLALTSEVSAAVLWAAIAAALVGAPALLYAFFTGRRFAGAASLLALFPLYDLFRRASEHDPARLTRPLGIFVGHLAPGAAFPTALLLVAMISLFPVSAAIRSLSSARRPTTVTLAAIALLVGLVPGLIGLVAAGWGRPRGPNILLITIDTLRADHVGAYGYFRSTSPHIDELGRRGVVFENAFAPEPRTTQSIASLMTSLYPQTHGVRTLWGSLGNEHATLAEHFRESGYATAAFWTTTFLDEKRGLSQGFDVYENTAQNSDRASEVTDHALHWLAKKLGARPSPGKTSWRRPFFLWLHYRDPHMPYDPPREDRAWVDPNYAGEYARAVVFWPTKELTAYNHLGLIDSSDVAQAHALYDGEIHYTDRQIGRLLENIAERGALDRTVVIVTADHGEGLSEHGYYFDHGDVLYDTNVRIPLLMAGPGVTPSRVAEPVSLLDLPPTVARLAGLRWKGGTEGRDLGDAMKSPGGGTDLDAGGAIENPGHLTFLESGENLLGPFNPRRFLQGIEGKLRGVRTSRWKLIMTPRSGAPYWELYDMRSDPAETLDVALTEPRVRVALEESLKAFIARDPLAGASESTGPDDETREKLEAMGYMGSTGPGQR